MPGCPAAQRCPKVKYMPMPLPLCPAIPGQWTASMLSCALDRAQLRRPPAASPPEGAHLCADPHTCSLATSTPRVSPIGRDALNFLSSLSLVSCIWVATLLRQPAPARRTQARCFRPVGFRDGSLRSLKSLKLQLVALTGPLGPHKPRACTPAAPAAPARRPTWPHVGGSRATGSFSASHPRAPVLC